MCKLFHCCICIDNEDNFKYVRVHQTDTEPKLYVIVMLRTILPQRNRRCSLSATGTRKSKSDFPLIYEGFKQAAPKSSVIICQNLCRRAPIIVEHLQLVDYTCHIFSRKMSPDGKPIGTAVDHRQKTVYYTGSSILVQRHAK